jgi:hypothetical protein
MKDFVRHLIEMDHPVVTTAKGAIGVGATSTGFYVSVLPKIEAWLRVVSLLVGITVGVLTVISLLHALMVRERVNGCACRNQKTKPRYE